MINKYKKIVIKIGSSSIVNPKTKKINKKWMKKICEDIQKYHKEKNDNMKNNNIFYYYYFFIEIF